MTEYTATVAKDLEDLIPTFMKNRHKELETLRGALAVKDLEQLRQIGHRMKGVGDSYGFGEVSMIGRQIEDGAKTADLGAIEGCIGTYANYLASVKIVYG